jgi:catalase
MHNFQRDGHMRMDVPKGRVAYEPSSLEPDGPRESVERGFRSVARPVAGTVERVRSPSFADHFTQARLFFLSQTEPEQNHIVAALVFELGKVETPAIRERMLSQLVNVDAGLALRVSRGLGLDAAPAAAPAAAPTKKNVKPSAALSLIAKRKETLEGRQIGCLVGDGTDPTLVAALRQAVEAAKAKLVVIAPTISGVAVGRGKTLKADQALNGAPSVLFDAVILALDESAARELVKESSAVDFVRDAFGHLKVIGYTLGASALLAKAGIDDVAAKRGLVAVNVAQGAATFVAQAKLGKVWEREPSVRTVH